MIRLEHDPTSNKGALVVTFQSQTCGQTLGGSNYPNLPPTSATPQKNRENSPGRPRLGTNPGEAPGIFVSWRKTRGYLQCLQNASWVS